MHTHFKCLFCFFAEDTGPLPERLFERLVGTQEGPDRLQRQMQALQETMREGGLFQRVAEVVPLGLTTSPYPDRIVARPGFEKGLAQRTLTQL